MRAAAVTAPIFTGTSAHAAGAIGITGIEERIVDLEEVVSEGALGISRSLGAPIAADDHRSYRTPGPQQ